jgi:hypothetical protein
MLVFNIKQVNLEHILLRTKQNLKHAIPIQTRNQHTLTEPNHGRNRKFLNIHIFTYCHFVRTKHKTYNSGEIFFLVLIVFDFWINSKYK